MLRSAQSEPIVFRLPQSQTHQALLKRAIDLRPQRVDNIFAGRGSFAKFFCFEIEMFVAPRRDGLTQYASEFLKIGERTGTFIICAANCAPPPRSDGRARVGCCTCRRALRFGYRKRKGHANGAQH